jgi:plasmid replication initiation protein
MTRKTKRRKTNKGIVLIKKANNLIESRYKFDIWETRFFLSVLAQIRRDDTEFQTYRIRYRDVIKTFGLKSGDSYALLRNAAKSLMGKSFFVNYEENGVLREKQYHILREVDYLKEGQSGKKYENQEYIDVVVEQQMKPLLLELQRNFTAYDLRNVVKLGVYPVRVYELLKQYQSIGERTLEVDEMKIMFEVQGQYKLFADFFRWVVKPAVKEINQYSDLTITDVEKIKEGRRVVALRFFFQVKEGDELKIARGESIQKQIDFGLAPNTSEEEMSEETEKDRLFKRFQKDVVGRFGVTPSVFMKLLDEFDEAQVKQAVGVTNRAKFNQQIKSNTAGFFVKALKNGYTDTKEEAEKKKLRDEKLNQIEEEKAKRINERIKKVTKEQPDITNMAIALLRKDNIAKVVIEKKEKKLGRILNLQDFRKDRILREFVKGKIVELAQDSFADILEDYEAQLSQV